MELAPNPRYSGGSKSSRRLISISYASAKTCKGDDSTAQGDTNKLKQYKHTKYKPRLNIKHNQPNRGLYELVLVAVHMETSDVQPKCQGPSTALPSFSRDKHHKTDAAKREEGGGALHCYSVS